MALVKWSFGEDDNKDEDPNQLASNSVQSVQNSWQPTQPDQQQQGQATQPNQNNPQSQDNNYLMSDQKAQVDEQLRQQRAAEEAARAEAAARAAAAAQAAQVAQAQAAQAQQAQAAQAAQAPKYTNYSPKYAPAGAKKTEGGFMGFLKGIGAGIQQGIGAVGDIAAEGGGVLNYAGQRLSGVNANQAAINATRQTESLRAMLHGMKDITGNNIVGTRDVDQKAANIAAGRGTAQDFLAVGGKGLQAGIDATMFMNPARLAAAGVIPKVTSASLLSRTVASPAVRFAARDAGFYGGLQAGATGAQTYGETGNLSEAAKQAAIDGVLGGITQGGLDIGGAALGKGARQVLPANRMLNSLRKGEKLNVGEDAVAALENGAPTAAERLNQAEEGTVTQQAPAVQDGTVSFENAATPPNQPQSPDLITPADGVPDAQPTVAADGVVRTPEEMAQATSDKPLQTDTPQPDAQLPPAENAPAPQAAPVAEGVVNPSAAVPTPDPNAPAIRSEQVKALQDAKAGASQADEAVINQRLEDHQSQLPSGKTEKQKFTDKENMVSEITDTVISRAEAGDISGAKSAAYRLYEDPEYSAGTERGKAMYDRGQKLNEFIKKQEARQLQDTQAQAPVDNSLPDGMSGDTPDLSKVKPAGSGQPTMKDLAARTVTGAAKPDDLKARLARAVDLPEDTGSPVRDLLEGAKLSDNRKAALADSFDQLDKVIKDQNAIQKENRKLVGGDNIGTTEPPRSKEWSELERRKGELQRDISNTIRYVDSKKSLGHRVAYTLENVVSAKNANQLASAPGVERNFVQDSLATIEAAIKNPVRTLKSIPNGGNPLKSSAKSAAAGWKAKPKSVSEGYKYVIGNAYETAMVPTSAVAKMRSQPIREAIAEMGLRSTGKTPTRKEIVNYARTLDGDAETLVNILSGVGNAMTNRHQANKAIKAYEELVKTGSTQSRKTLQDLAERQTTLAQKLVKGFEKEGTPKQRIGAALVEGLLPYIRVASNAAINATYRLVPNKTVIDAVMSSVRSKPENFAAIVKNKAFDYGLIGVITGMAAEGMINYNDGDRVDKPRGASIKVGDNQYIPIRATNVETEIAAILTAYNLATGKSNAAEALNTISDSLPYISSTENIVSAGQSALNGMSGDSAAPNSDGGYAAKNYGIGQAKSLVPFSNNGIQPYLAGKQGKSMNAKSVYDKDPLTWFTNTVRKSYDPAFNNSLKDSRDAAGRVRTVDNQGALINKTINDASTKEFNAPINQLVDYARKNKLGNGTQEMFNTYDTGKNNNFKSIQDSITFLDTNGGSPDPAKKLEKNAKLTDLSRQVRDGFYGTSGSELLMLDGQTLKSDASVPNKDGTKNSKLPLSMQSIKNAIAATDLPKDKTDRMYALSNEIKSESDAIYAQFKSKSITYDQMKALQSESKTGKEKEYVDILSGSESYKKMTNFMNNLDQTGFFKDTGLGSTKSGQTYLWNSLNAMLGSKGATPAANYPDTSSSGKGFTPWGRRGSGSGSGFGASNKPGKTGTTGVKWSPAQARAMASVSRGKYTPVSLKVSLGSGVKKDKTQNYSSRSL